MADTAKKSGVYTTPDDGTSTTPTSATTRRSGMPKWIWIAGLVVLALLLWWAFTPSRTGDATAPAGQSSTGSGALPAPAPAPTPAPRP